MTPRTAARRGGMAIVETALLMSTFLMFLFGVLEYARYLMALHVATNACRDAARYASVNVDKKSNFDYSDQTVGGRTYPSVWKYAVQRMGGTDKMISNLAVETFPCDTAKLYPINAPYKPVIDYKAGYPLINPPNDPRGPNATDYNNGNQTAVTFSRTTEWNEASFTEPIAVRIKGTYTPILPSFLFMGGVTTFNITMLCGSEG